jgi:transcriptional regulator GlxA family with amidase domain
MIAKNNKELESLYSYMGGTKAMKNKQRVRIRQLENELEQTMKKIDIVSRAKGFTKGRSNSKGRIKRTEFRASGRK